MCLAPDLGDVQRALALTPASVGDALSVAGTPRDWIDKIEGDVEPSGFDHLLVTFADPFLVRESVMSVLA